MIDLVLSRPVAQASVATQVDFLELAALIDPSGRIRIDTLVRDRELQAEEAEDNIGNADGTKDEFIGSIENEYNDRVEKLSVSYPFRMSKDADELTLQNHDRNHITGSYLACLIASHVGDRNGLGLEIPSEQGLGAEIITRMRNRIFQMIGTIALAGIANGPSASLGWPRVRGETIIECMERAVERGFPIEVRAERNMALARARDDGVDVVAWMDTDHPPSPLVWFGQIASGQNWCGKIVVDDSKHFAEAYLDVVPTNKNHATIIPFQLDDEDPDIKVLHHRHGHILDRMRLAKEFQKGINLIEGGTEMDESENTHVASDWVIEFVRGLRDLYNTT